MTCHKILLTYHSSYFFDKALNGSFVEVQNNEIKLREDSAEDMHAFVSWLYSGRLEI
jgi:BTB/POZ domain